MLKSFIFLLASAFIAGCSATGSYTSNEKFASAIIGPIEKKGIAYQGPLRNPVIVIHGFLGSNLIDSRNNKNLWGEFSALDSLRTSKTHIRGLTIPMEVGRPLKELRDTTVPDGILESVKVDVLGVTFKEKAYQNLQNVLQRGGFHPEGAPFVKGKTYNTLFEFSYDWRRDLQWNATKLHEFILEKRNYISEQYKVQFGIDNYDVQFDLIGHSMGGLIARYYLRYGTADLPLEGEPASITWAGRKFVDRLVILGTPNAGYLDTILELVNGMEVPELPPAVIGSWPTLYQMMPIPARGSVVDANDHRKYVDMFDPKVWAQMKWGLLDPSQMKTLRIILPNAKDDAERKKIAYEHLTKCLKRAKRFIDAMKVKATPPKDVKLYLVLGSAVETHRRAEVNPKTGKLKVIETAPGDGKVSTSSAIFDDRACQEWSPYFSSPIDWSAIIHLRAAHMGITSAPAFEDNILFLLNAVPKAREGDAIKE